MKSVYEEMKSKDALRGPGRPKELSDEEKKARQKLQIGLAGAAKSRAAAVLAARYEQEYEELYRNEKAYLLATDDKYASLR